MWKQLWNWVIGRGWNSLEGSEEDKKMWESLELPRDLLNGFAQNTNSDMDNKVQAEMVSDGNEEFVGNCSKGESDYFLAKRPLLFCPCPRDFWNFEVERNDLGYLAEEISKQQSIQKVTWVLLKEFSFKRETEHKSLESLQPDNALEKKIPFSEKKFKPAAEICISSEEPNVNPQDNGENTSRACQRSSWQPLPSQAERPRRKKWFRGPDPGSPCCVQPRDLVPCIPVAPAMAERSQCRAQTVASEGASPKPWQLPCGVKPVSTQKSRIGVWEPLPRFQRIYGNAWMPRQKFAIGATPSWRTSAREVQKGNVGSETPHRVPTGALPSGAVRKGPPSSRPWNGRSTDSLHCAPRKAAHTQCQRAKAAGRESVSCKATGWSCPRPWKPTSCISMTWM
uniref:Uncharacterized protein n=1 Tax=Papio anubis TaxID=9555 RepID=A0A8I5N8Q9_PAPAN